MFLYIIRHGDPDYKNDCLTERGKRQAEALAPRLKASGINRIFSSPMGRARETADPTSRLLGIPYDIEDWMREISPNLNTTYATGVPHSISHAQNSFFRENGYQDLGYERAFECPVIADTTMREAIDLITPHSRDFLSLLGYEEQDGVYIARRPNDDRVAVFCHAGLGRAWLSVMMHIPLNLMWTFAYTHTGVTILRFENYPDGRTAPKLLCYCDMSHLYAAGEDMIFDNRDPV